MFSCCLNYRLKVKLVNLAYFSIEEVRVWLELIAESLVWSVQEFGFISDSLKEGIIDLILDVVVVELGLLLLVILK